MRTLPKINVILFSMLFSVILLSACLRDFDLKMPDVDEHVAVTCFFTPDSSWQARVFFTHHIDSSGNNSGITDASVTIEDPTGKEMQLNHTGSGWYRSEEKPVEGISYKLRVTVDGYKVITAESYVPLRSFLSDQTFHPGNVLRFTINPATGSTFFASIRGRYFDTETGYNIYCITGDIIEKMKEQTGIPPSIPQKLKVLEGQTLYSYNAVERVQKLLTAEENYHYWYRIRSVLKEHAVCGKLNNRPPSLIQSGGISSEQGIFYHAPNDHSILLMNETGKQDAILNYGSFGEFNSQYDSWIEFTDLSSDYYYFLRDFTLQLSNREEINAPPVIIYSNIINGVGIFAGYQVQVLNYEE